MSEKEFLPCPREVCCYCGACVAVCARGALTLRRQGGAYAVEWNADLCTECGLCERVCPSNQIDIGHVQQTVWDREVGQIVVGPILQAGYGRALGDALYAHGQSGGLLSGVIASLLDQNVIDGAVVVGTPEDDPLTPEPFVARTSSELVQSQGSKYCPVPTARTIERMLREQGRYAFVGLPCQILALRKAESIFPRLKERVSLRLGLFCAGMSKFGLVDYLMKVAGVHREQVKSFRYRGHTWRGYPGDTEIELLDGTVRYVDRFHRQISRELFLPLRCFYCHDKLNTLADISFGDPWGLVCAGHEKRATAFLVRSREGLEQMNRARAAGFVETDLVEGDVVAGGQRSEIYERDFISRLAAVRRLHLLPPLYAHSFGIGENRKPRLLASAMFDVVWYHLSAKEGAQNLWKANPAKVSEWLCRGIKLSRRLLQRSL